MAVTHALKVSPLLAALTFGLVARHRRVTLNQAQRNFGPLGDQLSVVQFTYVATTIDWVRVGAGIGLALALIAVRLLTKVVGVALLARVNGTTWRKDALTGLALMPISVFVILLLDGRHGNRDRCPERRLPRASACAKRVDDCLHSGQRIGGIVRQHLGTSATSTAIVAAILAFAPMHFALDRDLGADCDIAGSHPGTAVPRRAGPRPPGSTQLFAR